MSRRKIRTRPSRTARSSCDLQTRKASGVDRRQFVQRGSLTALALSALGPHSTAGGAENASPADVSCPWSASPNRPWLGPDVWANPMQDWQVAGRQAQCVNAAPNRNVQRLTADLSDKNRSFEMSVRISRVNKGQLSGKGSAGFTIGIRGPVEDYRNRLIFGKGVAAGMTARGELFIGSPQRKETAQLPLGSLGLVQLRLAGAAAGDATKLTLTAVNPSNGKTLAELSRVIASDSVAGNVGLTANYAETGRRGAALAGTGSFAFDNWRLGGERVAHHPERAYGPVFFTQYTLHKNILKLTAQLPPLGDSDPDSAELQIRANDQWTTAATAKIHPLARTATFRVDRWNSQQDASYRVVYRTGEERARDDGNVHTWEGTIRRDPIDQDELVVADISCNIHAAFPNDQYVAGLADLNPDVLAFTGDQFYESTGGYGVVRSPLQTATVDYLRKWLLHGWTWRELTKDRPSVAMPDDHDVYQGNVWGEGGAARQKTQEAGGYTMPAEWVNVVHRTQTSHHPDPFDATPAKQGISVYYGPWTYGKVSFAILADRMFKTGPDGVAPPTSGRADHVTDVNFDPATADVPNAELLGKRQMDFLQKWVEDWDGAVLKAVLSQTVFTTIATTHGRNRQRLVADYDTNAWPQAARNEAVRMIRKCGAVHLAGDQHLPAVVRYGIEKHRDAGVAFAGPAVNVGYPRWWEPEMAGQNRKEGAPEVLGDFRDAFGHPMTMVAVFNPAEQPSAEDVLELMQAKGSGYGIARFNKPKREVTLECYPYLARPALPSAKQFPGWPLTFKLGVQQGDPIGHLPELRWPAGESPLIKVFRKSEAANGDGDVLVYALRPAGTGFIPPVFAPGSYRVEMVGDRDPSPSVMECIHGAGEARD